MNFFLETTIKGQSFQVVLDNEAFFLVKQTGFYIVPPFIEKQKSKSPHSTYK